MKEVGNRIVVDVLSFFFIFFVCSVCPSLECVCVHLFASTARIFADLINGDLQVFVSFLFSFVSLDHREKWTAK